MIAILAVTTAAIMVAIGWAKLLNVFILSVSTFYYLLSNCLYYTIRLNVCQQDY